MAGHLSGARLWAARLLWVLIAGTAVTLSLISAPVGYQTYREPCSAAELEAEACSTDRLTPQGLAALAAAGLTPTAYAIYNTALAMMVMGVFTGAALVIFWRRSDEPVGLFVSLALVLTGIFINTFVESLYALGPGWELLVDVLQSLFWVMFATLFYIFPDGHFVPRWTVWLVPLWLYTQLAFYAAVLYRPLIVLNPGDWPPLIQLALYGFLLLSCLFAQIYRFGRVSSPAERQQTKWVVFGFGLLLGLLVAVTMLDVLAPELLLSGSLSDIVIDFLSFVTVIMIPITFGVAILRYRLWEIDVIIRRTLTYTLLTAGLAGAYLASVLVLQGILGMVTGERQPPLVTVLSTLTIAGLFAPMRRRVQAFIDRRFYRRKYDAARTLAAFGETLRNEVELDRLTSRLLGVVEETMQPAQASLWLRAVGGDERRET
jgi:hypothetical protein